MPLPQMQCLDFPLMVPGALLACLLLWTMVYYVKRHHTTLLNEMVKKGISDKNTPTSKSVCFNCWHPLSSWKLITAKGNTVMLLNQFLTKL